MYQCTATFTTVARTVWVSDEVWARLDPKAGRLSARGRWALAGAAVLVTAAVAGLWLVQSAGLVRPRLSLENGGWTAGTANPSTRAVEETTTVDNDGWTAVRVESVTGVAAGPRVVGVEGVPVTIPAHGSATITVHYRVTRCAPPPTSLGFGLRVARWWGTETIGLGSGHEQPPMIDEACTGRP
jgi:hypothetical protein